MKRESEVGSHNASQARYAIGIDRGQTKIRIGLVRNDGKILKLVSKESPVLSMEDLTGAGEHMIPLIQQFVALPEVSDVKLDGIAVAIAGVISREGVIVDSKHPKDHSWKGYDLRGLFRNKLDIELPIIVENDSKAATWGEYLFGAGRGVDHMICITVGTGIGGGLIFNRKMFHGRDGYAGLLGFISVDRFGKRCPCGMLGCLNDYASGTDIGKNARLLLEKGEPSLLREFVGDSYDDITSEFVFMAARKGDELSCQVVWEAADAIGLAVAGLVHSLNPDLVVIGGGIAEQGVFFLDRIRQTMLENTIACYSNTPIRQTALGDFAGTIGAAALFWGENEV